MEAEEYNQFFKATFREFLDPLATSHFNVEGTIEFSALLFVPGMAPFEQQARASRVTSTALQIWKDRENSAQITYPCQVLAS